MSQINTERTYTIIGGDKAEARFSVFPTGTLQIDLLHTLCKLRAPCKSLSFNPHTVAGRIEAVDVSYSDRESTIFWILTIGKDDASELQRIIQASAQSLEMIMGSRS